MRRPLLGCCTLLFLAPAAAGAGDPRYEIQLLEGAFTPPSGVSAAARRGLAEAAARLRATGGETLHLLVQFHEGPDTAEREELGRRGIRLSGYVPGHAWIAAVPTGEVEALAAYPGVRFLTPWDAARKLHPRLRAGEVGPWARSEERPGWIATVVQLHEEVDLSRLLAVAARVGGVAMKPLSGLHGGTVWLPAERLAELAAVEEVLWIEEGVPPLTSANDGTRENLHVDDLAGPLYATGSIGPGLDGVPGLDGTGVRVLVYDEGPVNAYHETFFPEEGGRSRVTVIDGQAAYPSDHATWVAGILGGDGRPSSHGHRGRGMAPGVEILSAWPSSNGPGLFWDTLADLEGDFRRARGDHAADLATVSMAHPVAAYDSSMAQCSREGFYNVVSTALDALVRGDLAGFEEPMILIWSVGNERSAEDPWSHYGRCGRGFRTVPPPACAKNPIHVGAIHSDGGAMTGFSSWGPCKDGRLKPVVVAPGCETGLLGPRHEEGIYAAGCPPDAPSDFPCYLDTNYDGERCGTSAAAPAVAGVVALLLQQWKARFGADAAPLPALVKAMLIHTARDLGPPGPDYAFGYGAVDARALLDLLGVSKDGTGEGGERAVGWWATGSLRLGGVAKFPFVLPAGAVGIKVTLAWDDRAGLAASSSNLVTDLDVTLVDPSEKVWKAWALDSDHPEAPATASGNVLDNQEQVVWLSEAPRSAEEKGWSVRVTSAHAPDEELQSYALVYTPLWGPPGSELERTDFGESAGGWQLSQGVELAAGGEEEEWWGLKLEKGLATKLVTIPPAEAAWWTFETRMKRDPSKEPVERELDTFSAEVRDPAGPPDENLLAVVHRSDAGWTHRIGGWQIDRVDLSCWTGETVELRFQATDLSALATDFYVASEAVTYRPYPEGATREPHFYFSEFLLDGSVPELDFAIGQGDAPTKAIRIGDTEKNTQFRAVLSFAHPMLPKGAVVTAAKLVLTREASSVSAPFDTLGPCQVDVRSGFFGVDENLDAEDFQAPASATRVGVLQESNEGSGLFVADLNGCGRTAIHGERTQFRMYCRQPTNGNDQAEWVQFRPRNVNSGTSPRLLLTYLVPE